MKVIAGVGIALCLTNPVWANDSFSSEFGHAVGGAIVAGAGTAVADRFWPENRALIGFTAGVASGVLGELLDAHGHRTTWNGKHSTLDVASAAIGAGIGAWGTDKFLLMPVVRREQGSHQQYYGIASQYRF